MVSSRYNVFRFMRSMAIVMVGCCCVLTTRCTTPDRVLTELAKAEALAETHPDSALMVVRNVDRQRVHGKRDNAYYALVYSEVLYYNRIKQQSDSLTHDMSRYYRFSNNHDERARAMYQHGLVMHSTGKSAEAIFALMAAEESCRALDNPRLEGLVYRTMGDVYGAELLFDNAIEAYAKACDCFQRAGLEYHDAHSKFLMGGTYGRLRNFDDALPPLHAALEYAIDNHADSFLCSVLHELAQVYLQRGEYREFVDVVTLFDKHDCLFYDKSNYYCYRAIMATCEGEIGSAHEYIDYAASLDDADPIFIDHSLYLIYFMSDRYKEALELHRRMRAVQDEITLKALSQPMLNTQIDALEAELEAELQHQRKTQTAYIAIIALIVVIGAAIIYRYRRARERYIIELCADLESVTAELHRQRSSGIALDQSVGELFGERLSHIEMLLNTYHLPVPNDVKSRRMYDAVDAYVNGIRNDKEEMQILEELVNKYKDNSMSVVRSMLPNMNSMDYKIICLTLAGFSTNAISVFTELEKSNIYNRRSRIKRRMEELPAEYRDKILANFN